MVNCTGYKVKFSFNKKKIVRKRKNKELCR